MSTDAGISWQFQQRVLPSRLWAAFQLAGWGRDVDDSISILTPENVSTLEWIHLPDANFSQLAEWFAHLDCADAQTYGILLVHQKTEIGGHFFVEGHTVHWWINVNIPYDEQAHRIVDHAQCLRLIWPVLNALDTPMVELRYRQWLG
jgi:hypothetical protein